ncbi:hypothetical protein [Oceanobacillus chungangensis]|uniref:DUF4871 domain-containing protein n=1 Tax=Oceanobacillus chungangensis TaxID=1229152 RepID=A0A3D8PUJ8_9BACI|nr:hypothetical protein [Oceanobacillus chungangensis]RDW18615.1 hypothetical protein CWR45_09865 [Oceanobacillus chungangensis]
MKRFCTFLLGLFFVVSLAGCFGEEYDFSPPTASLTNPDDISQEEKLAEANIDWTYDEKYNEETDDILSLAKKQNKMYFNSRQRVQFNLEDGHFDAKDVKISLWQDENKIDLAIDNAGQYFNLPKEKGEYMIVLDLPTDKGTAQYVGSIVIQ